MSDKPRNSPRSLTLVVDHKIPYPARKLLALVQRVLGGSPSQARAAIAAGRVFVNGRAGQRFDLVLGLGDRLEVAPKIEPSVPSPARRGSREPRLVFEDTNILVVEKPPRMLTVPTPYREKNTLIAKINQTLQKRGLDEEAFCVHRLDRDVSGLLVFGKSIAIAKSLRDQFASRKPRRVYQALVMGQLADNSGTFSSHLATDKQLNRFSVAEETGGELAITHFEVLRRCGDATLVQVTLETGRRNQIRVHFAEAGHPLIGETRYRREEARHPRWPHRHIALHALELGFDHPVHGRAMHFKATLPPEFRKFLNR